MYAATVAHLRHHQRFYAALVLGLASFALTSRFSEPLRIIAASDTFFVIYLLLITFLLGESSRQLKARAAVEDEGILLVVLIVLVAVTTTCAAIIVVLHHSHGDMTGSLVMALAGAPLGWFTLHVVAAFHYANLYYAPGEARTPPLQFPGGEEPAAWDFLYYAFVVGMTAQVSDVQVVETRVRRATLGHSVVSFLFNTVLIAMAVNAVVTLAA